MGDPETKRKRYCLMCNVFKPDRCHHCSACNRCVLNMDHHCPWVNNCIGFWNRKHFLLLLFYAVGTLLFFVISSTAAIVNTIMLYIEAYKTAVIGNISIFVNNIILDINYLFSLFLVYTLVKFTYFHVTLVIKNITTLESLENKGMDYNNLVTAFIIYSMILGLITIGAKSLGKI